MWYICKVKGRDGKKCGWTAVSEDPSFMFNRIREHYIADHGYSISQANMLARQAIKMFCELEEGYKRGRMRGK